MRSDLIFDALPQVSNRYQLCRLAATATRKLHKPRTRIQDTRNSVQMRPSKSSPVYGPQAMHDGKAALELWQRLLMLGPYYPDRSKVEQLIQQVQAEGK